MALSATVGDYKVAELTTTSVKVVKTKHRYDVMLDLADDKAMNSMFKDSFNNRSAGMIKISLHDESSEVIRKIIEYFATGDAEIRKSIKASEGHFYKAIL